MVRHLRLLTPLREQWDVNLATDALVSIQLG
jgi:hypothetical protein